MLDECKVGFGVVEPGGVVGVAVQAGVLGFEKFVEVGDGGDGGAINGGGPEGDGGMVTGFGWWWHGGAPHWSVWNWGFELHTFWWGAGFGWFICVLVNVVGLPRMDCGAVFVMDPQPSTGVDSPVKLVLSAAFYYD